MSTIIRKFSVLFLPFIIIIISVGCGNYRCVEPHEIEIDVLKTPQMITLFENDSILIQVPQFYTPNGDGRNDFFTVNQLKNNETFDVIVSGSFEIKNKCDQIYYTEDKNQFIWSASNSEKIGKYNCNISFVLIDGNEVENEVTFELHR